MRYAVSRALLSVALCIGLCSFADVAAAKTKRMTEAQKAAIRKALNINANGDKPLQAINLPPDGKCETHERNGFPVPDPGCTPGAINPTLTLEVLTNKRFKTGAVRDEADGSSGTDKKITYQWYGIKKPVHNRGQAQVCELDHFISLEIGGADTLDNIWPQCGPSRVTLMKRYFKQKDGVEDYLAWLVKNNSMDLSLAQTCIAHDWTQFLKEARKYCRGTVCPKGPPNFEVTECEAGPPAVVAK